MYLGLVPSLSGTALAASCERNKRKNIFSENNFANGRNERRKLKLKHTEKTFRLHTNAHPHTQTQTDTHRDKEKHTYEHLTR